MKKPLRLIVMIGKFYLYGFFLQVLFINLLHANSSSAQNSMDIKEVILSVDFEEVPLSKIFSSIQSQTNFSFFYENGIIAKTGAVSIDAKDRSLEEVLLLLARDYHLSFKQVNDRISVKEAVRLKDTRSIIIEQIITGTVTDANGDPLPGVTVSVSGTSIGTATDLEGKYTLSVPEGSTLVFSFIGFESQRIEVGSRTVIDVTLNEDMTSLDEVVVVGYGVQKKVNLTGSVSAIDFESENMESRPLQNMSTALSGMAAGLNVNQQNGKPSGGASLRVRGIGSLNSSQSPLIIIDGQVGDLNSVNPNDVASVSVLKDAASAAIYGSRASNGVILITTKTGETDGKVSFNYTGNTGFTQAAHLFDVVSSTVDQMELINLVQRNSGINPSYSEERIQEWRERSISDPLLFPNTDWWDAILQNGQITNHNVSARGGNERVNFFTSLGYLNNEGIITNTGYRKFNFRNNITYKVNEWLELGNIITAQIGNDDPASINGIFQWFETLTPGTLPKHPDGRYGISMTGGSEFSQNNPQLNAETALGEINSQRYTGKLFANVTPIEGLKMTGSYFIDMLNNNNWTSSIPVDRWNFQENSIAVPAATNIGLQNAFSKGQRHVIDLFADYNISFAEHNFGLILGYNQEYFRNDSFNANKTDLISIDVPVLNAAATLVSAGGNSNDFALRSYFGRVTYNLKEKYLIEANMRMDGSSRFSPDNRWGIFPSFSAGWIISNEAFWGDFNNIIDFLKIRTSYGRLGNNGIGNYDWQAVYQAANYSFNGQIVKGITTNAYANSNITWETTDVFNFATDLSFPWNLSLSLDYYNKLTHGILSRIPIPFVNGGLAAPLINSAKVKNTGIEAEINYRTDIQDISINFSINGSYNNNKIEEYKGDYLEPHGVGVWTEGQPIGKYWLRQVDRIVQEQDEIDQLLEQGWEFSPSTPGPGDFLYKDTDGNTIVNDGDRVLMGNPIPLYTYGGNFSIAYKGIDLFAQFNGVAAWDKYFSSIVFKLQRPINGVLVSPTLLNSWTEENTNTNIPKLYTNNSKNDQISDYYLRKADYFRIKSIQVGYTFPNDLTSRIGLYKARIYFNLENFFTFTSWPGLDPETSLITYPIMKSSSIGLNIGF